MASPKNAQTPTAHGDKPTTIAAPDPSGDEPPRLIVAINANHTDAPKEPHCQWGKAKSELQKSPYARAVLATEKHQPADNSDVLFSEIPPPASEDAAPKEAKSAPKKEDPKTKKAREEAEQKRFYEAVAKAIPDILQHVAKRLDQGLDNAWKEQEGASAKWRDPSNADADTEEKWAKAVTKLFLATEYLGTGLTYLFDDVAHYRGDDTYNAFFAQSEAEAHFATEKNLAERRKGLMRIYQQYIPLCLLTSEGSVHPDDGGKAVLHQRLLRNPAMPKGFMQVLGGTWNTPGLDWDKTYLHPDLGPWREEIEKAAAGFPDRMPAETPHAAPSEPASALSIAPAETASG